MIVDTAVARKNTVLVAIADRDTRRVVTRLLEKAHYRVLESESNGQLLGVLGASQPHLVVLDVSSSQRGALETCRRIKSSPEGAAIPVVIVSRCNESDNLGACLNHGADDVMSWPLQPADFQIRLEGLMRMGAHERGLIAVNRDLTALLEARTEELERLKVASAESDAGADRSNQTAAQPTTAAVVDSDLADAETEPEPEAEAEPEVDQGLVTELRQRLARRAAEYLEGNADLARTPELVKMLHERLNALYASSGVMLPVSVRDRLFAGIVDDLVGYGPIEPLLADPSVSEIMINGPKVVYVERKGRLQKTEVHFDSAEHLLRVVDRIIRPLGRRLDRKSPMVDARLPNGSRVNAIIAPCANAGPVMTIRKFREDNLSIDDLISFGSITRGMADFLEACVKGRCNIIVSGGTGSGKTTMLNVLSSLIPAGERIVTIEDSIELQLQQGHVVQLEAVPPDLDGSGEVTIRQLLKNSLRMRPDRIVVGEVRGSEALDMLQAMNTGHDGSLSTIHANTPRDTIARLETLVLMAGVDFPIKVVRNHIVSAVDLIVQLGRLRDGSRKVTAISEIQGMEGDVVVMMDIFSCTESVGPNGEPHYVLEPTGMRPRMSEKLEQMGLKLPPELFSPRSRRPI